MRPFLNVARAKRRNPAIDPSIFDFLRDILMLKGYEELDDAQREARHRRRGQDRDGLNLPDRWSE